MSASGGGSGGQGGKGGKDILFLDGLAASDDLTALRHRAADLLEGALDYVLAHGDPLSQLRAYVALEAKPQEVLLEAVSAHQRQDGAFDPLGLTAAGATGFDEAAEVLPAPLLGSLEALAILSDARALHADFVAPLAVWLGTAQRSDGSWGRDAGPKEERLFATGMIAGFLGRTRVVRPEVLQRAGGFLDPLFSPEAVEGGSYGARAAFAQYFANNHHDRADEVLQWCGRELERAFRTRTSDAQATLRILLYCEAAALPGATLDVVELLEALLAEQASDGGFAELAAAGPAARVAPTIDAMLATLRLCRALPAQ